MAKKDLYNLLGIARNANADEIKKAFRKLAIKYHPDKNQGDKKSEETFKELTEAYEILSDPKKREMYDQFGFMGAHQGAGAGQQQGGGFGPGGFAGGFSNNENFQDIFGDIFGDVFGGRAGGGFRQTRKQRGADLRYTLNVSFEESSTGAEKTISFIRNRSGQEETARLAVKVPSGVKHGQRLRLTNEGDGSPSGGANGDLYVVINILEHPIFRREEDDVVIDVPVIYVDAILGAQIEIPTLTGRVSIKVPAGTYSGQILRVKGKGFPKSNGFGSGDLLVRVLVDTPANLTGKQRDLLEELAKNSEETPQVKVFKEKVNQLLRTRK